MTHDCSCMRLAPGYGSMQYIHTPGSALQVLDFWLISDVIWHKQSPGCNFRDARLSGSHETLHWAASGRSGQHFHCRTARDLSCDGVSAGDHGRSSHQSRDAGQGMLHPKPCGSDGARRGRVTADADRTCA